MNRYLIRWEIDLDGESPLSAAREALEIMRDPASTATIFDVIDTVTGEKHEVDLYKEGLDDNVFT